MRITEIDEQPPPGKIRACDGLAVGVCQRERMVEADR
jgi:hypothetical protein